MPVGIQNMAPIQRFTRTSGTRLTKEARGYDIINNSITERSNNAGRSRSRVDADFNYQQQVKQDQQRHFVKAVDSHLKKPTSRTYDIINMQALYGREIDTRDGDGTGLKRGGEGKKIDQDGGGFVDTARYALHPESYVSPPTTPRTQAKLDVKRARREREEHGFNIVNHEYLKDHDAKVVQDREREVNRINAVAMATGSAYNPLTTKYRLEDEEAKQVLKQQMKEEKARREYANHTYKVSNIIGQSDGHAFNLITNEVCNPECTLAIDRHHIKGMPQRAALRDEWEHRRDEDEAKAEKAARLALNRINVAQRVAEVESRGHDILSNRPFATTLGSSCNASNSTKPLVPMESLKAQTALERLEGLQIAKKEPTSSLVRPEGPRTSHERVFVNPPTGVVAVTSSKDERQRLLLPVLQPSSAKPRVDEVLTSSVIGAHSKSSSAGPYQALSLKRKVDVGAVAVFGTGGMKTENGRMETFY